MHTGYQGRQMPGTPAAPVGQGATAGARRAMSRGGSKHSIAGSGRRRMPLTASSG
jgi:hypothetical protein